MSWLAVIPFLGAWCAGAVTTSPEEIAVSRRFYATHFDDKAQAVPFSFVYDGQSSDALLAAWPDDAAHRAARGAFVEFLDAGSPAFHEAVSWKIGRGLG